jgi:formylglycine-generating enzyme required for sulfatase activity
MSRLVPLGRSLAVVVLSSLVAGLVLLAPGLAQTGKGKKYALLVGVRTYDHSDLGELKYTENDVVELAASLKGFTEVVVLTSTRGVRSAAAAPTAANIRAQLARLLKRVTRHDTMLVALAGHGLQIKVKVKEKEVEEGFFCPSDARPRSGATLDRQSESMIGFSELFRELEESGAGTKLLLVDACRNDPKAGRSVNADAMPRAPRGMAALFSCRTGERAFETPKLGKGHGVFFHHVIQGLKGKARNERGEVTWSRLADYVTESVGEDVPKLIGGGAKQTPEQKLNITGRSPVLIGSGKEAVAQRDVDKEESALAPLVKKDTPGKEKFVKEEKKEIRNSIGMRLVRIPAGKFTMGSSKEEQDEALTELAKVNRIGKVSGSILNWYRFEGPQHEVEITKAFYLGACEVTQAQYREVMGSNPSYFCAEGRGRNQVKGIDTSNFPVERVSWGDAVEFCKTLSGLPAERRAGSVYRLPTEAEWEYACRGGDSSSTPFHFGNSLSFTQANFDGNHPSGGAVAGPAVNRTCEVRSYKPNKFGLYDMHGNVWEWCADWYAADFGKSPPRDPRGPKSGVARVIRGGGWNHPGLDCRSARRDNGGPNRRNHDLGFRVVRVSAEE